MSRPLAHRRGRSLATFATGVGLILGSAALTQTPAQSAEPAEPVADCAEPFPLAEVAKGDEVTGLTVTEGTTPEGFTGEVLGVLKSPILPGRDLIMARLTSPEVDRVGIWGGMSGSPVYAEDGRLIGAVAWGLTWGASPVAGITPFEEMDDYLTDASATRGKIPARMAKRIAATTDVTVAQAEQGIRQLPMPMGVSGVGGTKLSRVLGGAKAEKRDYLTKDVRAIGGGSAEAAGPETIVAGGNLFAAASYGDITMGGTGTATSVCDGEVVGFGHSFGMLGETTLSMHPAEAIYIQEDDTYSGFKVANPGAPAGTITEDHWTAITGSFGALPETMDVASTVTYRDRSRTGETHVSIPEANPAATFYQHVANHDRVIDAYIEGSEVQDYLIEGTDEAGAPFSLGFTDRHTSNWDISIDPSFEIADMVWALSNLSDVTLDRVEVTSDVDDSTDVWRLKQIQSKQDGAWAKVKRSQTVKVEPGKKLRLRAILETATESMTVPLKFSVPNATGRATLYVTGGNSLWSWPNFKSVADAEEYVDSQVRNDMMVAEFTSKRSQVQRGWFRSSSRGVKFYKKQEFLQEHVVNGYKQIRVKIKN